MSLVCDVVLLGELLVKRLINQAVRLHYLKVLLAFFERSDRFSLANFATCCKGFSQSTTGTIRFVAGQLFLHRPRPTVGFTFETGWVKAPALFLNGSWLLLN